jgi:hypothetical protein
MIDLCCMAGNRDQLITLLLQVAECAITILLVHFHDEYEYYQLCKGFCFLLFYILKSLKHDDIDIFVELVRKTCLHFLMNYSLYWRG